MLPTLQNPEATEPEAGKSLQIGFGAMIPKCLQRLDEVVDQPKGINRPEGVNALVAGE